MSVTRPVLAVLGCVAWASVMLAQGAGDGRAPAQPSCPPDVKGEAPTIGRGRPSAPLSDQLADSKGVICPPTGIDPDMQVNPPAGGQLKVVPPPGSPGGNPNVQPK